MADYKKMYLKLFNSITDATNLLQTAQTETEKMYIEQEDPDIILLGNHVEDE